MTEQQSKTIPEFEAQLSRRTADTRYMLCAPIPAWPEKAAIFLSFLFILVLFDVPKDGQIFKILASGSFVCVIGFLGITIKKLRQKVEALSRIVTESEQGASTQQKHNDT